MILGNGALEPPSLSLRTRIRRVLVTILAEPELRVSVAQPPSFGLRLYVLFVSFLLLVFPLHESAHYLTYRLMGVHLHMTLNTSSPRDQSQRRAIAEFAGPLMNLVLASVCALVYYRVSTGKFIWGAMALAASMMRLVIYLLIIGAAIVTGSGMTMGNDEPIAAHLWGLPSLTFVAGLTPLFSFIVWVVLRTFAGSIPSKFLNVFGLILLTLGIGMLVGNVLDPLLFPNR